MNLSKGKARKMTEVPDEGIVLVDGILRDLEAILATLDSLGLSMASIHVNGAIEELRTAKQMPLDNRKD